MIALFAYFCLSGSLEFSTLNSLAPYFEPALITVLALGFLVGGFAKSAQLGLHSWLPNAMEGPTPVSALLHAATMVVAGVFLLLRISPLLELSDTALLVLIWIGSLTALMAGTTGVFQNDLKRVIAYSTCSQLGMLMMACGLSEFNSALFHLVNHAFFKALLFLSAGALIHAVQDEQDLRALGGLVSFVPYTYIVSLIGSMSLMAYPFLTGFYSKELLIMTAYGHYSVSGSVAYWLAAVGAGLTATYSLRLLFLAFLSKPNGSKLNYISAHDPALLMAIPLAILAVFSVFFGYIAQELFIGPGSPLLSNGLFQQPNPVNEAEFTVPLLYKLLPLIAAILAYPLLLVLYSWYSHFTTRLIYIDLWRQIYTFFNRAFLFDGLYSSLGSAMLALGHITAKSIDKGILELLGPSGLTNLILKSASRLASLYSGYIPEYVTYISLGLVGILALAVGAVEPKVGLLLLCSITLIP